MKKVVIGFIVFVSAIVLGAYVILFTQIGNNILKPTIQKKLSFALKKNVEVEEFSLRPSTLKLVCSFKGRKFLVINGKLSIFSKTMDLNYSVFIPEISDFTGNSKIRGSLNTKGRVFGSFNSFDVVGKAQAFGGVIDYSVKMVNKKPYDLVLDGKGLKLEQALSMFNLPVYAKGVVSVRAKFANLAGGRAKGGAILKLSRGLTNPSVIKKQFNIENVKVPFSLIAYATAKGKLLHVKADLKSTIGRVKLLRSDINLNSFSAKGLFRLSIPNLDSLYFLTKRHMKGGILANGDFKKDKNLVINAVSKNLAGGVLKLNFFNGNVKIIYKNGKLVKILDMLEYPKVFDSLVGLNLVYSLNTKKGESHIKLINGHFLPNRMSYLINTLAGFDITRELYRLSTIDSKINNMVIVSNLFMKSRLTEITSKNAYVNLNTNKIDATLDVMIAHKPLKVLIKGNLNKPEVKLNIKGYIKSRLKKKLKKGLKNKLEKTIKVPKGLLHLF